MAVRALADVIQRYTDARGGAGAFATAVDGLTLHRADHERRPAHRVFTPTLCVVAQGSKRAIVGDRRLEYRAGQALVASVEVPGAGWVAEASPGEPYLGVILEFDLGLMREVLEGLFGAMGPNGPDDDGHDGASAGVFVMDVADGPLGDCVLRLVRLLDTPAAIPTLRPLILRELCYWLLTGPRGGAVARMALGGTHAAPVLRAVQLIHGSRRRDDDVGVKCRCARGCWSSHVLISAVLCVDALSRVRSRSGGVFRSTVSRKARNSWLRCRRCVSPITRPVATSSAANRFRVPCRT